LNRFFEKEFFYNWSPNPVEPGLGDFIVVFIRNVVVGLLFVSIFHVFGLAYFAATLWASLAEEQARVTWIFNAERKVKAGLNFAIMICLAEMLISGIPVKAFESLTAFREHLCREIGASVLHLVATVIALIALQRGASPARAWFLCAACHLAYNGLIVRWLNGLV
jgi:hypothetical protein